MYKPTLGAIAGAIGMAALVLPAPAHKWGGPSPPWRGSVLGPSWGSAVAPRPVYVAPPVYFTRRPPPRVYYAPPPPRVRAAPCLLWAVSAAHLQARDYVGSPHQAL